MAFCTIARDQNNEIQEVYAPNKRPSLLFSKLSETFQDKEQALRVWARAYTNKFKQTFGDWESISEALQYKDEIKSPIYSLIFEEKPQQVLFEAAIQANSSKSEKAGAIKSFGKNIVSIAQKVYPTAKSGDVYKPVVSQAIDENGEPLPENVMSKKEKAQASFIEKPGEVEEDTRVYKDRIEKVYEIEPYDIKTIEELNSMKSTFVTEAIGLGGQSKENAERIVTHMLRLINHLSPNAEVRFVAPDTGLEGVGGFYMLGTDRVYIVKDQGMQVGIRDLKALAHELVHKEITSKFGTLKSTNKTLYDKAEELYNEAKDKLGDENFYGLTTIDEFFAEAMSNRAFQQALNNIPSTTNSKKSILDVLLNILQNLFAFKISESLLKDVLELSEDIRLINMSSAEKLKGGSSENINYSIEENPKHGSRVTIDFFEDKSRNIELKEEGDISYYTNGTIDPVTNTLRRYARLTEYTRTQFAPEEDQKRWTEPEKYLDRQTQEVFRKANAELTDKIPYGRSEEPLTYDQIKAEIKKSLEESRIRGNIIHKMIEGYLKFRDIYHFSEELEKMRQEGGINEYELLWFDENRVKRMLEDLGYNSHDFNNTDIEFRDNIAAELRMVSDALNVGTSNDGFIEHSDGSVSFIDYKTGAKFLANENSIKKMLYSNGLASPIYNSTLNKAKLELVMRMIIAKMNKPDLQVRDLKIAYISRYYGNQIRNVDVQAYLDYINNNMRLTIKELEKDSKKDPSLKDKLVQKKKEYKAMQDAKVFDFFNYTGENKIFEQDETLSTTEDPVKRVEIMKKKVAEQVRENLITTRSEDTTADAIKRVRSFLLAALNSVKSANATDVEKENKRDISALAARGVGLRNQKNGFIHSFSQLYETAVDALTNKTNKLLGEQSELKINERALYKEYFQRTGRSQSLGAKTFSYSDANTPVPISEQGIFDFMYTWKNIAGENKRVGAVYTEQDYLDGKLTKAQWEYYKSVKSVLRQVYEAVRNKTAYIDKYGRAVTYGQEYKKNDGYSFEAFQESFLPTTPFRNPEEIIEKNILTKQISPIKITKEFWENYEDRYNLAIQNEDKFNIGVPLKYMSNDFIDDNEHSYNVANSVDVFVRHMLFKEEMDDIYHLGKATIAVMGDLNDPNARDAKGNLRLQNAIFALQNHLDQQILGRRKMTFKWTQNEVTNRNIDRAFDNIGGLISKNAFWFAPITGLANGLYNAITAGKEGLIGSLSKRYFGDENAVTSSHMAKAALIAGVHQGKNLTKQSTIKRQLNEDWEGSYYKDKVNFMSKMFRLGNKNYQFSDSSLMYGVHNRIFTGDNAYVFQGLGEDTFNETFVIASLLARKVEVKSIDANGKEITKYYKKDGTYTIDKNDPNIENMWDVYKLNETTKEYEYTGPTRFLDKDGQEVKGLTTLESLRVKQYLERMFGAYSPEQKTWFERYSLGRALMKFRKFQIAGISENFTLNAHMKYVGEYQLMLNPDGSPKLKDGQPLYDWQTQMMRARFRVLASLIGSFFNMKNTTSWSEMSTEDKKQLTRAAMQLVFYGIVLTIGLGGLLPPEDKDKLYYKRITRLASDLSGIDPIDLLRSGKSINSYPEQLFKLATSSGQTIHSLLTDDIVQSGPYKGDYKGWNTLEDFIPIYHPYNQAVKTVSEIIE